MSDETKISCSAMILYSLITMPLMMLLRGWTIKMLWGWFFVSTFHLPAISVARAYGMSLFISLVTMQITQSDLKPRDATWERTVMHTAINIFMCVFTLSGGWIIQRFWM